MKYEKKIITKQLKITGLVQGVGFRPFLFTLAKLYDLKGEVSNTTFGVIANAQGSLSNIDKFIQDIQTNPPPLSYVTKIVSKQITATNFKTFQIIQSTSESKGDTLISPDVSICPDCLLEMQDPDDRRFEYPFINCTNCGPRFTIIKDTPYDRSATSMNSFTMCPDCQKEYDNPSDRRFHAQPNACQKCGPRVWLTDNKGCKIKIPAEDIFEKAGDLLQKGKILAIKGLAGFHLTVDARNDKAVRLLRKRKQRPHKPFALMARSDSDLFNHLHISNKEETLLNSFHRPVVLFKKKQGAENAELSPFIAPLNPCLGVMLPYTPLHYILLKKSPDTLVMTSGNTSGEPLSIKNSASLNAFSHIADFFLFHNRNICFRADDSIVRVQAGNQRFIRRSRGYVPLPLNLNINSLDLNNLDIDELNIDRSDINELDIKDINIKSLDLKNSVLKPDNKNNDFNKNNVPDSSNDHEKTQTDQKEGLPSILGCGAEMKNTICLTKNTSSFLSQHIGELNNRKVYDFYVKSIDHLKKIVNVEPAVIAHDMHPDYMSTQYAKSFKGTQKKCFAVQHHHAHAASCMAENSLKGTTIAITLDGMGYGTDGNIWGGEILICSYKDFTRAASLAYLPMPGGDRAVLEPWRMAASVLFKTFGRDFIDLDIKYIKEMDRKELEFMIQMIEKNLNCPLTSSVGRLFDAVSSLLCLRHKTSYENQAAMELEAVADIEYREEYADSNYDLNYDLIDNSDNLSKYTSTPYAFSIIEKKQKKTTCGKYIDGKHFNEKFFDGNYFDHNYYKIDFSSSTREIVDDIIKKISNNIISQKFHQTIVKSFATVAGKIATQTKINRVVLSGGVFNNDIILTGMIKQLEAQGLKVFTHTKVPTGDGGICLGQVVCAAANIKSHKETK